MSRIALYVRDFQAGGVPRTMLNLALGLLQNGCAVDFVVNSDDGDYSDQVPRGVRTIVLSQDLQARRLARRWRALRAAAPAYIQGATSLPFSWAARHPPIPRLDVVAALAGYLGTQQPATVIAAQTPCNLAAIWARRLAAVPTRLVLTEPVTFSKSTGKRKWHAVRRTVHSAYLLADDIVAVSAGAADDLARTARLPRHALPPSTTRW